MLLLGVVVVEERLDVGLVVPVSGGERRSKRIDEGRLARVGVERRVARGYVRETGNGGVGRVGGGREGG